MDAVSLYDEDFYAWSEQQAAVLRRLGQGTGPLPNGLDLEHVIEEVEDLGRAELRTVRSLLRQIFIHLVKIRVMSSNQAVGHWMNEADTFRYQAADHYSRSMAQHMELDAIWSRAIGQVAAQLERGEADATVQAAIAAMAGTACPFMIQDLMVGEPRAEHLLGLIEAASSPAT